MANSAPSTATAPTTFRPEPSPAIVRAPRALLRFMRRKPLGAVGLVLIVIIAITAIFADVIATNDPGRTDPVAQFQTPGAESYLGTDNLGRDIFSRIVYGARVSAVVGPLAVVVALFFAMLFGGVPGFIGGKVDLTAQRIVDMLMAFPPLIILISAVQLLPVPREGADLGIYTLDPSAQRALYLIGVLGVVLSFSLARVVRSAVLGVKSSQYVEAARSLGATEPQIFRSYILPNIFPIVLVIGTVTLGTAILAEASTSFLGVGLPPDIASWGRMLSEGRSFIQRSINVTIWPGLAIALTVFGFNMLGDALRDELDPRLRGSR